MFFIPPKPILRKRTVLVSLHVCVCVGLFVYLCVVSVYVCVIIDLHYHCADKAQTC